MAAKANISGSSLNQFASGGHWERSRKQEAFGMENHMQGKHCPLWVALRLEWSALVDDVDIMDRGTEIGNNREGNMQRVNTVTVCGQHYSFGGALLLD
ncbi:hypothetical protein DdX_05529 [Ditylenchus destructor]|uniref:Uncharacterized protein n=1 Tax=Ditylenchus destructor TaxID=166010 RepID=A0AAD4NCH3_9BILA|nr:hypothetical protein DdX_05529 [Ditylenchus destructor]